MEVAVDREVLQGFLYLAREAYPREFFAFLGGEAGERIVVREIVFARHVSSLDGVLIYDYPPPGTVGTVHSHPVSSFPSAKDLQNFLRLGLIHFIVSYPFTPENIRCYDFRGREVPYYPI